MVGIAAVMGAVSIFAVDAWLKNAAQHQAETIAENEIKAETPPPVSFKTIVVAKDPLRFGMPVDAANLTVIPWPQEALPQGAFQSVDALFADGPRVVLTPIEANEPVLLAKLSGPNGRATLSNLLAPGMRAVTIKTDEIAGVGGFVTPGDHVDVVLTRDAGAIQEVQKNADGAAGSTITSEVVVENAKVLSVGQGADERQTTPQVANSVTVEVTGEGAQKIALARTVGTLSLTLRASAEENEKTSGITTISSFGGSIADAVQTKAADVVETVAAPPAGPSHTTVVVTRALESKEYEVVETEKNGQTPAARPAQVINKGNQDKPIKPAN